MRFQHGHQVQGYLAHPSTVDPIANGSNVTRGGLVLDPVLWGLYPQIPCLQGYLTNKKTHPPRSLP